MPEKLAVIGGLVRNQKGGAFRRKRVGVAVAGQQSQPNQRVADGRGAPQRNAGFPGELRRGFWGGVEQIEQAVFHRGFDDQRRRITQLSCMIRSGVSPECMVAFIGKSTNDSEF